MNVLTKLRKPRNGDLDEWVRHHDDPRSQQGMNLLHEVRANPELTYDELHERWQQANRLVGQRAPADYGEFLAYGYIEGRRDALQEALGRSPEATGPLPGA